MRLQYLFAAALFLIATGCATGTDGVNRRGGDGGSGIDAGGQHWDGGPEEDAGEEPNECDPGCEAGELCVDGECVPDVLDADGDGIPADRDCDDTNPAIGSTAERECSNDCGVGRQLCTDGVWDACDAPASCECTVGSEPRMVPCVRCGQREQSCIDGTWTFTGECTGMGACSEGETDYRTVSCGECGEGTQMQVRTCRSDCTWGSWMPMGSCSTNAQCSPSETDQETRSCTGGCGGTESRTRTCNSSTCRWNSWGSWSGCAPCGPVCGNGVCESGETCQSCADCRYGHGGTGENGDSCAGVPAETWRCVYSSRLGGYVSQFCRNGKWTNFNFNPRNCSACRCSFSLSCCQAGYTGSGCS